MSTGKKALFWALFLIVSLAGMMIATNTITAWFDNGVGGPGRWIVDHIKPRRPNSPPITPVTIRANADDSVRAAEREVPIARRRAGAARARLTQTAAPTPLPTPVAVTNSGGRCRIYSSFQSWSQAEGLGYTVVCAQPGRSDVTPESAVCRPIPGTENGALCAALVQACGMTNNDEGVYSETCVATPPPPYPASP
jgi:hypothetical protein